METLIVIIGCVSVINTILLIATGNTLYKQNEELKKEVENLKTKKSWSEEDERMMKFCCDYLDESQQKWLKFIKIRMEE